MSVSLARSMSRMSLLSTTAAATSFASSSRVTLASMASTKPKVFASPSRGYASFSPVNVNLGNLRPAQAKKNVSIVFRFPFGIAIQLTLTSTLISSIQDKTTRTRPWFRKRRNCHQRSQGSKGKKRQWYSDPWLRRWSDAYHASFSQARFHQHVSLLFTVASYRLSQSGSLLCERSL